MEELNLAGIWWLPNHKDEPVAGKLTFSPVDGGRLEIIGDKLESKPGNHYPIICGAVEKKGVVTLWDCRNLRETWNSTGFVGSIWRIGMIFRGCLFSSEDDLVFEQIAIRFSNLELWLDNIDIPDGLNLSRASRYGLTGGNPSDVINVDLDRAKVEFRQFLQQGGDGVLAANIERSAFAYVTPAIPAHVGSFFREHVTPLRNFLTLAIDSAVDVESVQLQSRRGESLEPDRESGGRLKWSQVYFADVARQQSASTQADRFGMFLRYSDLRDSFGGVLQNWWRLTDTLDPVMNLYFGLRNTRVAMFLELEFVMLTQVLEAYHRRVYGGIYMSEEDYKSKVGELLSAIGKLDISKDHRESLKNKVKYGYEFSLRKRVRLILETLLEHYGEVITRFFPSVNSFAGKVSDTRNYLTHYSKDMGADTITDVGELALFVEKLHLLVRICFCLEIGLSPDLVSRITIENHAFGYLLERIEGSTNY